MVGKKWLDVPDWKIGSVSSYWDHNREGPINSVIEGHDDFRECRCGYQYSYREYRRNYRKNNMPSGAAAKVFDEYIQNWIRVQGYNSKMILINKLLHEFHLSLVSGAIHRPVAMNFIDGTREKVTSIINELANN